MQDLELTEFDKMMMKLANDFQEAIKASLAMPYPFAPGYSGGAASQRKLFGVRNMKTKTGALYNSISVKWVGDPDSKGMKLEVSMLDYWEYVNNGRKPGKYVPIKPLMAWIRSKGFNKSKKTGKFQKFNIKGMAFAISTNIKKFGIQPTYFYDDAYELFLPKLEDEAVKALGIDATTFFEKVVEETLVKQTKK
jgi:hypothetical protein